MTIELRHADQRTFEWLSGGDMPAGAPALCPGGIAPSEVLPIIARMAANVRAGFAGESAWLVVADGEAVGLISYKRAPQDGSADIGYGIAASREGRGFATDAVRVLARQACAGGIARLTAETSLANRPSQRVLEKAGFERIGAREDAEDGPLVCWALDLPEGSED